MGNGPIPARFRPHFLTNCIPCYEIRIRPQVKDLWQDSGLKSKRKKREKQKFYIKPFLLRNNFVHNDVMEKLYTKTCHNRTTFRFSTILMPKIAIWNQNASKNPTWEKKPPTSWFAPRRWAIPLDHTCAHSISDPCCKRKKFKTQVLNFFSVEIR